MQHSYGSWFLILILEFSRGTWTTTTLQNFQIVFPRNFKGKKVTNLKIPGGFFRKVYLQSSLIAQSVYGKVPDMETVS